jgi:quinol monooxygenase YgiN
MGVETMIVEIAEIDIREGSDADFERGFAQAKSAIEQAAGCHGAKLYRGIERPLHYRLMVQWESVELHDAFRLTAGFQRWRQLVGSFFAKPPSVDHVRHVVP